MTALLISVRFHDGRYHGRPDWPPSPARLFQALVAGAAQGKTLAEEDCPAFAWLETLDPPVISAPSMRAGQPFKNFVPNNDRDAVESKEFKNYRDYLAALGKIRTSKEIYPILFDAETPLLYVWTFDEAPEAQANARRICAIAERLYQLGRGVDMAWAWGEILTVEEAEACLAAHGDALYRPGRTGDGKTLAVPVKRSLESLVERHEKMRARFQTLYESKPSNKAPDRRVAAGQIFVQPPKPRFRQIAYESPPARPVFDLVGEKAFWRLDRIVELTERVRDAAAQRLKDKRPDEADTIHNAIVGRRDGDEADKAARLRITPLPSIGHRHADHAIRRILVEIPPNCPLRGDDVEWAFSGLLLVSDQGEILSELATAAERGMLAHYGVEDAPARLWRTVTPAALPQKAARRRIEPSRIRERSEQKDASERIEEEMQAASAVRQALRHVQVDAPVETIRVQREPFEAKGARAEVFSEGSRFAKERLWHIEIAFAKPVRGPLVLGDGRYLGLGLFAPVRETRSIFAFALTPCVSGVDSRRGPSLRPRAASEAKREAGSNPEANRHTWIASSPAAPRNDAATHEEIRSCDQSLIAAAARRAVMARVQERLDRGVALPAFFSGHETNGAPNRPGHHAHLFYAVDLARAPARLLIIAPHRVEHRNAGKWEPERLRELEEALTDFTVLRAGKAGLFKLSPLGERGADDPLCGLARTWVSATPYRPTRHPKREMSVEDALIGDVLSECARRNLPRPDVEVLTLTAGPRGGISARLRLTFSIAVEGPILLGRDAHEGGGVFKVESVAEV
jgi:CRISPR-associated protein Csb2